MKMFLLAFFFAVILADFWKQADRTHHFRDEHFLHLHPIGRIKEAKYSLP